MDINEFGELQTPEDVNEKSFRYCDYSDASFNFCLEDGGYICINAELLPSKDGLVVSGRYLIINVDVRQGTNMFYMELDGNTCWKAESAPPFVTNELIDLIGHHIDQRHL